MAQTDWIPPDQASGSPCPCGQFPISVAGEPGKATGTFVGNEGALGLWTSHPNSLPPPDQFLTICGATHWTAGGNGFRKIGVPLGVFDDRKWRIEVIINLASNASVFRTDKDYCIYTYTDQDGNAAQFGEPMDVTSLPPCSIENQAYKLLWKIMNPATGVTLHNPTSDEHGTYNKWDETIQTGAIFFNDDARELIRREVRLSMYDEWDFDCTYTQAGPFEGPYPHAQDPHNPSTYVEVVLYPTEKFPSLPEIEQFDYSFPIVLLPDKSSSYSLVRNMKKNQKIVITDTEESFAWVPVTDSKLIVKNLAVTDLNGSPVPASLQVFSECNESRAFDIRIDWSKANQVATARSASMGLSAGLSGGITKQVQTAHQVSSGHAQTIRVESPAIDDFRTIATPLVLEIKSVITYDLYEKSLFGIWEKTDLNNRVYVDTWFIPTYSQSVELRPCSNVTECPIQYVRRSRLW